MRLKKAHFSMCLIIALPSDTSTVPGIIALFPTLFLKPRKLFFFPWGESSFPCKAFPCKTFPHWGFLSVPSPVYTTHVQEEGKWRARKDQEPDTSMGNGGGAGNCGPPPPAPPDICPRLSHLLPLSVMALKGLSGHRILPEHWIFGRKPSEAY